MDMSDGLGESSTYQMIIPHGLMIMTTYESSQVCIIYHSLSHGIPS